MWRHCNGLPLFLLLGASGFGALAGDSLLAARDAQNRPGLEKQIQALQAAAKPNDAASLYRLALAQSYLAEVAQELRDKNAAKSAAEAGMDSARKAIALKQDAAEYHRLLGTLCGQVIPANVLAGLKYGRCAQESVNQALKLNPNLSEAHMARGVGNYYLPASFGGGVELAIKDFEKAIQLNPKSADAYLWLGIALRKANRNADARKALAKSVELNPNRVWAKQQLEKTPAP
jgi:tetratricopeptide (TPR) repeat protein